MAKKRSKLEIIRDILQLIKLKSGRIKPTHILYKSNLSYSMMSDYLEELISKGFIKQINLPDGKTRTYEITRKGDEYLSKYKLVMEFTDSFGLN
ncbi:MAG: winged helix-turn-helix domain-containing protein [Nanoarchaeota archaeon]